MKMKKKKQIQFKTEIDTLYKSLNFDIKVVDSEKRIVEGYASTVDVDLVGDRGFPEAFKDHFDQMKAANDFPVILYAHDQFSRLPVGKILSFEIVADGIKFTGKLSKATGLAKEVWEQVKEGILRKFSIGYRLLEFTNNEFSGVDFKKALMLEVSFAPVPIQSRASLTNFKNNNPNPKKEDIVMSELNLKEDKTFQGFSQAMQTAIQDSIAQTKTTAEGVEALKKMVETKSVSLSSEEHEKMDKIILAMQEAEKKYGSITKDLAERFPARKMEFPVPPNPNFTGEKAYENLVETPVEFVHDDQTAKKLKEWQKQHDTVMLGNAILYQKYQAEKGNFPSVKFVPIWEYVKQSFVKEKDGFKSLRRMVLDWNRLGDELTGGELTKVLAPATAGAGLEFIPTQFSAQLFDRVRAALLLAGRFIQVNAPSDPYKWPVAGGDIYGVGVAPSTALPTTLDSASTPTATANVTFTHSKMRLRDGIAAEEIEDSIVAVVPYVNERLAIGAAKTLERAIINGDNLTPHMDTDVQAVSEATKGFRLGIAGVPLWNGLRWLTINTEVASTGLVNAGGTGAFSLGDIQDGMAKTGKFGLPTQLNNLVHVMGVPAYYLGMKFAELLTIEKFGPFATVVNGVLTKVLGIDVLPSGEFPVNLTGATAINDAGANNTTSWIIVNTNAFAVSYRRGFQLESVRLAAQDMFDIFGFLRVDFKYFYPSSNGKFGVAGGFGDADTGAVQVHNIIA